ncbi:MAG: alpha/beta fold hydrolase [Oscillospiraceae bacterium]|nr:alpha/beta fold hydrolase [Oscillospiraceae bacterium]
MKKMIAVLLTLALCLSIIPMAFAEEAADPTVEEGYTVEGEGFTSVVSWCKNGDLNIYGKFYYPEGFDATQKYPVVIMSHGLGSKAEMVERAKWPQAVTKKGFIAYAFDFCGGGMNSTSDGDFMKMSVLTEASDLNAVIDFVKSQAYADPDNLFLLGQSQGGFVSAITAASRPEEVKAMVLVYPALCLVDDLHEFVPDLAEVTGDTVETAMGTLGAVYARDAYDIDVMNEIAKYTGDVMIIHGLNDKTVPYSYSLEAITTAYSAAASELVLITGKKSAHGFEMVYNEGREYALDAGTDFLSRHVG